MALVSTQVLSDRKRGRISTTVVICLHYLTDERHKQLVTVSFHATKYVQRVDVIIVEK